MGTLTAVVSNDFIKAIDKVIKSSNLYSSRSEFLKDAIREKFEELVFVSEGAWNIRKEMRKLGKLARSRGWDGKLPTREKREEAFLELAKEKGFKI